jgi:hypothetical protein
MTTDDEMVEHIAAIFAQNGNPGFAFLLRSCWHALNLRMSGQIVSNPKTKRARKTKTNGS